MHIALLSLTKGHEYEALNEDKYISILTVSEFMLSVLGMRKQREFFAKSECSDFDWNFNTDCGDLPDLKLILLENIFQPLKHFFTIKQHFKSENLINK